MALGKDPRNFVLTLELGWTGLRGLILPLTLAMFSLFPCMVRGLPQELEDVRYRTEGCGSW